MLRDQKNYSERQILHFYRISDLQQFREFGVEIIEHNSDFGDEIGATIDDPDTYFGRSPDGNDARDAAILIAATRSNPPGSMTVACNDTRLNNEFKRRGYLTTTLLTEEERGNFIDGFNVSRRSAILINPEIEAVEAELSNNERIEDFERLIKSFDPGAHSRFIEPHLEAPLVTPIAADMVENNQRLDGELDELANEDREIRVNTLAAVYFLSPVLHDDIRELLIQGGSDEGHLSGNIDRLLEAGFIRDTGSSYLPNDDDLCQQAALTISPEIMALIIGT